MKLTAASPDRRALPLPSARLLSRLEAAAYAGVGATTFDKMVEDGSMPRPKRVYSRVLWDVRKLDSAIEALPGDEDNAPNPWDD
ncbi:helix-turn-helix transcriptional regulator [Frigidibacter sp. MR17.24]|uniref:helix-turn-helix transcriptional regulator n=1 Tax=Frigidibacter sp. MR17.24 TaxID=3127345 RepID=UPI003012FC2B